MDRFFNAIFDHLPTIVTVLLSAGTVIWAISRNLTIVVMRVDGLSTRVGDIEVELRKMTDVLVNMARQDEQIKSLIRRVDLQDVQITDLRKSPPRPH